MAKKKKASLKKTRADIHGDRVLELTKEQVARFWMARQGLAQIENLNAGNRKNKLTRKRFSNLLNEVGGLQVDSVNVVDRAHYLTLWSRFGEYDRAKVDRWVYKDRIAYEYWGHEASIMPVESLPVSKRRMKQFPSPEWKKAAWWSRYNTPAASKKRVLARLNQAGPLESTDFDKTPQDLRQQEILGWGAPLVKEDKRSLQLLWHAGKVAISNRRHFRKVYDLAERVYQDVEPVSQVEFMDHWLLTAIRGCGVAPESHMINYLTAPKPQAAERKKIIERNLKQGRIIEVGVESISEPCYTFPHYVDKIRKVSKPEGTTLVCPFDSFLWQRQRAEDLLGFRYRIEIYVPEKKREFGYYVLPILHDGKLVGRVDPKLHRDNSKAASNCLELKNIYLEKDFKRTKAFEKKLRDVIQSLASFLDADTIKTPRGWNVLSA